MAALAGQQTISHQCTAGTYKRPLGLNPMVAPEHPLMHAHAHTFQTPEHMQSWYKLQSLGSKER